MPWITQDPTGQVCPDFAGETYVTMRQAMMTSGHLSDTDAAEHWYALHGDEHESAQNAKQGSSASGKTLNT